MSITQPANSDLFVMANNSRVTLTAAINASQTTVAVSDITKFSSSGGYALVYSTHSVTPGTELLSYTGVSGSSLIGVVRGLETDLGAKNADSGDTIVAGYVAQYHNVLRAAIQTLASEAEDLRTGVDVFTEIDLFNAGTDGDGIQIQALPEGGGGVRFSYNRGADATYDFEFGPDASAWEPCFKLTGDSAYVACATDQFRVYAKNDMEDAAELGVVLEPDVADGASAVAYDFVALNDLATSTAMIMRVTNVAANVFAVYKAKTAAVTFQATSTTAPPFNAPVHTVTPSVLNNGDIWISDIASTRQINARIGGVTYSVTLS